MTATTAPANTEAKITPREAHRQWLRLIDLDEQRGDLLYRGNPDTEAANFLALCQQVEAAKNSDDPVDRMWLQWHQDMAQAHGLHPDAIAASPVHS